MGFNPGGGGSGSIGTSSDVVLSSPATGQALVYNSTTAKWQNQTISGGATDATTSANGIVRLTGDLGGTAASPTTPTAVHVTGTETIAGSKTFSSPVTVATPTASGHAATKNYVDTQSSNVYTIAASTAGDARNFTAGAAVPTTWTVIWMCNGSFSPTNALANDIIFNTVGS